MKDIEKNKQIVSPSVSQSLIQDLRQIINQARGHVAATANYAQTMMYWHIGERINREVLGNQRAEYGKQIVATVARQLQEERQSRHQSSTISDGTSSTPCADAANSEIHRGC